MTTHPHIKHHRGKKFPFAAMTLVALGLLAAGVYLYRPGATEVNGNPVTPKPASPVITEPRIVISPTRPLQGEPVLIVVEGLASTTSVKSFTFDNRPLVSFLHEGWVTALLGVDVHATTGTFPVVLTLNDGEEIRSSITIQPRPKIEARFDIPDKLGGNTPKSLAELISTLNEEAKIMNSIPKGMEKLWSEGFGSPLGGTLLVHDPFGYTRITGNTTLIHKGVDLVAPIGAPVYAMNQGLVRFADSLRNYGETVVIDHGMGLQTVYMHLSELSVENGQMVNKGELIGKSGDTGYVLDPHLHLTVRVWGVAVDPIKFLEILGEEGL